MSIITNPFNLRPDGSDWLGMSGTSNNFVEFKNPTFGLRAGFKNMYNQKQLHNINTIDDYINKYAPTSDNSTASVENYKQMLEKALGVSRGDTIDLNDPDTMLKIGKAQIQMEQGNNPYADSLLRVAIAQATTPENLKQEGTAAPAGTLKANSMDINTNPTLLDSGFMQRHAEQLMKEKPVPANSQFLPTMPATLDSSAYQADIYPPQAALAQQQQTVEPNPYTMAEMAAGTMPKPALSNGLEASDDFPSFISQANAGTLRPQNDTGIEYKASIGLPSAQATPKTGQTRKQTNLSLPDFRIGRDEMLMRVGGAMMGASPQGGLAAYQSAINQYGDIQDYNRSQGLAAFEAQAAQAKEDATNKAKTQTIGATIVNDAIGRALPIIEEDIEGGFQMPSTGIGSFLKVIPGSQARSLSNLLDTVKSNIGFDKLQSMREASPTGGALGQVSNQEIAFLQQTFGNLDQANSPDEIKYNLQLLQKVYNDIIHGENNHQFTGPSGPAPSIPQTNDSYDYSEADKLVGAT